MLDHAIAGDIISAHPRLMITGLQIKLARLMLGWSIPKLAERAQLGPATVQRAESAEIPPVTVGSLALIERALQENGIIFIAEGQEHVPNGGIGIRIRKRAPS